MKAFAKGNYKSIKWSCQLSPTTVGILGGMGPAATADFFEKLVRETPASCDQEHLRTIIWSDTTIPDRSNSLISNGPSPVPKLIEGINLLQNAGADVIAMPCSTAHAYLPELRQASKIPFLSMIDSSVRRLSHTAPSVSQIGLLATTGTLITNLYQESLCELGINVIVPSSLLQRISVMKAVRLIKAGDLITAKRTLLPAIKSIADSGAELIIAACTELPLILGTQTENLAIFDPTIALAQDIVELVTSCAPYIYTKEE